MAVGERLVRLERAAADPEEGTLLAPNLETEEPVFFRRAPALRERSFLRGGQVRFLGGEKAPITLERGSLLRVSERTRFQLRRLRVVDSELAVVFWGKPTRLESGPTQGLLKELLPSVFTWLSAHRLSLIFSVLGTLLAAVVALLRLLGWVRKEE